MGHELDKLDIFLGLAVGTSYDVLIRHCPPVTLNPCLAPHGIQLDGDGLVPRNQRSAWRALMQRVGIDRKYWKDPDMLLEDRPIPLLEMQNGEAETQQEREAPQPDP